MRVKNIDENIILIRKLIIGDKKVLIPTVRAKDVCFEEESVISPNVITNWFSDLSNFHRCVTEFVKPYRSSIALKFRLEKVLSVYFPERKPENDKWLNSVLNLLERYFNDRIEQPVQKIMAPKPQVEEYDFGSEKVKEPVKNNIIKVPQGKERNMPLLPLPVKER